VWFLKRLDPDVDKNTHHFTQFLENLLNPSLQTPDNLWDHYVNFHEYLQLIFDYSGLNRLDLQEIFLNWYFSTVPAGGPSPAKKPRIIGSKSFLINFFYSFIQVKQVHYMPTDLVETFYKMFFPSVEILDTNCHLKANTLCHTYPLAAISLKILYSKISREHTYIDFTVPMAKQKHAGILDACPDYLVDGKDKTLPGFVDYSLFEPLPATDITGIDQYIDRLYTRMSDGKKLTCIDQEDFNIVTQEMICVSMYKLCLASETLIPTELKKSLIEGIQLSPQVVSMDKKNEQFQPIQGNKHQFDKGGEFINLLNYYKQLQENKIQSLISGCQGTVSFMNPVELENKFFKNKKHGSKQIMWLHRCMAIMDTHFVFMVWKKNKIDKQHCSHQQIQTIYNREFFKNVLEEFPILTHKYSMEFGCTVTSKMVNQFISSFSGNLAEENYITNPQIALKLGKSKVVTDNITKQSKRVKETKVFEDKILWDMSSINYVIR